MSEDTKQKIADYLAAHHYLRLGTVGPAGTPQVHTVAYVSDGALVYFSTDDRSRKARNIEANPGVAYAVDENYDDWLKIRGVQMEGTARRVSEPREVERVTEMFLARFPQVKEMPPELQVVIFEVKPQAAYFLNNSVEFGHRDQVEYLD